jgi:hypothetical protein
VGQQFGRGAGRDQPEVEAAAADEAVSHAIDTPGARNPQMNQSKRTSATPRSTLIRRPEAASMAAVILEPSLAQMLSY